MQLRDPRSRHGCAGHIVAALASAAVIAGFAGAPALTVAQETSPVARAPAPTRVIVKFRETASARSESQTASVAPESRAASTVEAQTTASAAAAAEALSETVRRVAARARLELRSERALPLEMHVVELDSQNPAEPFDARLARLRADPEIEFAEPDEWRFPLAVPNDPLYAGQWFWQNRPETPSAVNAEAAWDTTTGASGVVIAVLDTGVLFDHPDLGRAAAGGRLLPGYDFITNAAIANDGNGRDPDPSDPGDWVEQTDAARFLFDDPEDCPTHDSSWHGTRVSGLIGARTDNSEGIAGGTWASWILPLRVLGKCGGFDSDIIEAMAWAAGMSIAGVPGNPHPANVLNLSLGSSSRGCPNSYRNLVDALTGRGVLVVASSGNDGGPVSAPASCSGVLGVTGLRQAGTKVGFSNVGPEVGIGAPGGNCVNITFGSPCIYSIDTTFNTGETDPGTHAYTDQINANYGTSFAAPIVSAVAGLMLSVNGNLRSADLIERLRESANPFPAPPNGVPVCHVPVDENDLQISECGCTTATCGAGMVDAPGAVAAAMRPIAAIAAPAAVQPGDVITLSGAGSAAACGQSVAQYAWEIVSGSGAVSSPNTPDTTVTVIPLFSFTVRLTVTDDAGRQDSAEITVNQTSTVTDAPADAGTNACPAEISPIGVLVEPGSATLLVDGTLDFDATVVGVAAGADNSVTWQVNGIAGGNATVGSISSSGQYTAPTAVPTPSLVTITAVSNADARATGAAQVTITAPAPPPPPPPPSGGGGGAALDLLLLLLLPAVQRLCGRWRRRGRCRGPSSQAIPSRIALSVALGRIARVVAFASGR